MSDFYALLKQSILDRGIRNAGEREEIYAQARRAVVKQLWDYRPPLAADEIDTRVGAYDTAVERIEADLQLAFADGRAFEAARRAQPRAPALDPGPAAGGRDDDLPAFTDWLMDEPDYEPGVERSSAYAPPASRPPPPEPEPEPAFEEDEQPLAHDGGDDDDAYGREPPARSDNDRWSEPDIGYAEPPAGPMTWLTGWFGTGEQMKVRALAVAIGVLFIGLVGIGAAMLGGRGDRGVTLGIGVRREVSDAATAARIATDHLQVAQTYAVFDGRDPTVFSTMPDNPIRFDNTAGFARVASSTSASGVKVLIGPGLAARLAGQRVRVIIVARSSTDSGAANMRFAYQSGLAISHWQTANLGPDYAPVGMIWRLPAMRTSPTGDYLLIEPGIPGDGTGADIQSIKIDVLAS